MYLPDIMVHQSSLSSFRFVSSVWDRRPLTVDGDKIDYHSISMSSCYKHAAKYGIPEYLHVSIHRHWIEQLQCISPVFALSHCLLSLSVGCTQQQELGTTPYVPFFVYRIPSWRTNNALYKNANVLRAKGADCLVWLPPPDQRLVSQQLIHFIKIRMQQVLMNVLDRITQRKSHCPIDC
jgi:hypothetical protein